MVNSPSLAGEMEKGNKGTSEHESQPPSTGSPRNKIAIVSEDENEKKEIEELNGAKIKEVRQYLFNTL